MGFFRLPRNRCRNVPRVRVFVNVETSLVLLLLLLFLTFSALVANPKKTTSHGGQSRSWSAEQGKKEKEKVWQRTPPPPPPRAARSENVCVCVLIELHVTARFGLCRRNQSINDNKATRICSPQYASACARACLKRWRWCKASFIRRVASYVCLARSFLFLQARQRKGKKRRKICSILLLYTMSRHGSVDPQK